MPYTILYYLVKPYKALLGSVAVAVAVFFSIISSDDGSGEVRLLPTRLIASLL